MACSRRHVSARSCLQLLPVADASPEMARYNAGEHFLCARHADRNDDIFRVFVACRDERYNIRLDVEHCYTHVLDLFYLLGMGTRDFL